MTDRTDLPSDSVRPGDGPAALPRQLQVEPLDEVTRARLVRTALAAAPAAADRGAADRGRRRARWLAAAAAIVAVVAVGVSVLVRDSEPPQTTASAPTADAESEKGTAQQLDATAAPGASRELGRARVVAREARGGGPRRRSAARSSQVRNGPGQFRAECPVPDVGTAGVLISVGTGTVNGEPASVYVIEVPAVGKVRGRRRRSRLPHCRARPVVAPPTGLRCGDRFSGDSRSAKTGQRKQPTRSNKSSGWSAIAR